MWEKLCKWIDENREYGITLFYAYDPISQKPSITLFMAYVSFIIAIAAGIYSLFFPSSLIGTFALMTFAIVYTILYMVRSINKAKFNLQEKSFELQNEERKNNE